MTRRRAAAAVLLCCALRPREGGGAATAPPSAPNATIAPSAAPTAAPATAGTATPSTAGTAAPTTAGTAAPMTAGTTAPATGTTPPATAGTATPATTGTTAPATATTTTAPATAGTTTPATVSTTAPATTGTTTPTAAATGAPAEAGTLAPRHAAATPHPPHSAGGDAGDDAEGEASGSDPPPGDGANDAGPHVMECLEHHGVCSLVDLCSDKHDAIHDEHAAPSNVMTLACGVAVGALMRYMATHVRLLRWMPYTILIFLLGLFFGLIARAGSEENNPLSDYDELADIDPHLIFFIFLPILIFESAFAMDVHTFKKVATHCLILAGPGVGLSMLFTAAICKLVFWTYEWSWVTSLLFGAMCSATDPVAVVALLKDLGCGDEISSLIEGESLLNDGTAIVLFSLLKGSIPTGHFDKSGAEVFGNFLWFAIGGPIIGLLFALMSEQVLARVFNDPLIEVTLSLAAAYVAFYIAEGIIHVSGVLALVVYGLYLSSHRHMFSPEVEHLLHGFWSILVFVANTLIFGVSGIIVAEKAFLAGKVEWADVFYLLALYLVINFVRLVVVMLHYKLVSATNLLGVCHKLCGGKIRWYRLDSGSATLLWWGGLRGAVGLALALIIENDIEIQCAHSLLGPRMMFHISGIVMLTLCVNGISTQNLVRRLGLDRVSVDRRKAMSEAVDKVVSAQELQLCQLSRHSVMASTNWKIVRRHTEISDPYARMHTQEDMEASFKLVDAWDEGRSAYFTQFTSGVWQHHHDGMLSARGCRWLVDWAEDVRDVGEKKELLDSAPLRRLFEPGVLDRAQGKACCGMRNESLRIQRWNFGFEVTIAFVKAQEHAVAGMEASGVQREVVNRIRDHCRKTRAECLELLGEYQVKAPGVAVAIKTIQATRTILNTGHAECKGLISSGMLNPKDGAVLNAEIERLMARLGRSMKTQQMPEATEDDVLDTVTWASIDAAALHKLRQRSEVRTFKKQDLIIKKDSAEMAVLISGVAHSYVRGRTVYRGPGYAVGLLRTLSGERGALMMLTADTDGRALYIDKDELMIIMRQSTDMHRAAWAAAAQDASTLVLSTLHPYNEWTPERLQAFCVKGVFLKDGSGSAGSDRADGVGGGGGDAVFYAAGPRTATVPRGYKSVLLTGTCDWVDPSCDDDAAARTTARAICVIPEAFDHVTLRGGARVYMIRDMSSGHEKACRHWARLAARVHFIHTIQALLCGGAGREDRMKYRSGVVRRLIEGLFRDGKSLDQLTGGFGDRDGGGGGYLKRMLTGDLGSPRVLPGSPRAGHGADWAGGVAAPPRRRGSAAKAAPPPPAGEHASTLSEPLLNVAAAAEAESEAQRSAGAAAEYVPPSVCPPPPASAPRNEGRGGGLMSPPVAGHPTAEEAAAAGLESAAEALRLLSSLSSPRRREGSPPWSAARAAGDAGQAAVEGQLRDALQQAVTARELAEEQLLLEREARQRRDAALFPPRPAPAAPPPPLRPPPPPVPHSLSGCVPHPPPPPAAAAAAAYPGAVPGAYPAARGASPHRSPLRAPVYATPYTSYPRRRQEGYEAPAPRAFVDRLFDAPPPPAGDLLLRVPAAPPDAYAG